MSSASKIDVDAEIERFRREGMEKLKQANKAKAEAKKLAANNGSSDYVSGLVGGFQLESGLDDTVIAPPQPSLMMFYGLVGDVAKVAATGTEINPVAAAMVYLSFLGANVGRDTFLLINNTYHHPRLFTMHIGRSGRGGKGDSQQLTQRIRRRIEERDSSALGKTHSGGLSSREGLAALIHDGFGDSPAIADKRLWIIESEFANVLHQSKREGNTLSTALREVWDGGDIKPATKSKSMGVSNPHIGIHANITPGELKHLLHAREMSNGFANRFLMVFAENIGDVPFPMATSEQVIDDLAEQTLDIIRFAKGGYPNRINGLEMVMSPAAKSLYEARYAWLKSPVDSDFLLSMLERIRPYALRLAMLFALTDQTRVIDEAHLQAALEWIDYAINTVSFVFTDKTQDREQIMIRQNAEKILAFLQLRPDGSSMRELINDCFQKHASSAKINAALNYLLAENPPKIAQIKSDQGVMGRPKTTYRLKNILCPPIYPHFVRSSENGYKPQPALD